MNDLKNTLNLNFTVQHKSVYFSYFWEDGRTVALNGRNTSFPSDFPSYSRS